MNLRYMITDGHFINYELVESGWTIPDGLAMKVSEVLNKFPITPEDELQDALDDMARDIALIEQDRLIDDGGNEERDEILVRGENRWK